MSKEIRTEIIINASPEKVWSAFTDFKSYSDWNPFISSISGEIKNGGRIHVSLLLPGKKGMRMQPKILAFDQQKEFRWKGHLFIPGIFDGEHIFELKDNKNGTTTFIQRENFGGILVPLFTKMLDVNTVNGFKLMNQKLKERVEAG